MDSKRKVVKKIGFADDSCPPALFSKKTRGDSIGKFYTFLYGNKFVICVVLLFIIIGAAIFIPIKGAWLDNLVENKLSEASGMKTGIERVTLHLASNTLKINMLTIPDIKSGTFLAKRVVIRYNLMSILKGRYSCRCRVEEISFTFGNSLPFGFLIDMATTLSEHRIVLDSLDVNLEFKESILWARDLKVDSDNIKATGFIKIDNGKPEQYNIKVLMAKAFLTDKARQAIKGFTTEEGGWIEYTARKSPSIPLRPPFVKGGRGGFQRGKKED